MVMNSHGTGRTFFRTVRVRSCLYWLVIAAILFPFFLLLLPQKFIGDPVTTGTLFSVFLYGIPAAWLLWKTRHHPGIILDFFRHTRRAFTRREALRWIAAVLCTMALSVATATSIALLFPETKEWFFTKTFSGPSDTPFPFLNNLFVTASLIVVAPVFEELFFRGVFLQRWGHLWNVRRAIVLSGVCFAVIHLEPVGSLLFGILMSMLFLRTGSLVFPVIAHFLNNFLIFLLLLPQFSPEFVLETTTIREDMLVFGVAMALALLLFIPTLRLLKDHWPPKQARL
jgi:membrane protease YdiL (CAAX protease family)